MDFRTRLRRIITLLMGNTRERRKLLLTLSCVVVFITTYALIFPAFALDIENAAEQGGTDVSAAAEVREEAGENVADDPVPSELQDNTPIWKLGIILTELIILGFLSALIVSDLKVINWHNKKRKP